MLAGWGLSVPAKRSIVFTIGNNPLHLRVGPLQGTFCVVTIAVQTHRAHIHTHCNDAVLTSWGNFF